MTSINVSFTVHLGFVDANFGWLIARSTAPGRYPKYLIATFHITKYLRGGRIGIGPSVWWIGIPTSSLSTVTLTLTHTLMVFCFCHCYIQHSMLRSSNINLPIKLPSNQHSTPQQTLHAASSECYTRWE
jgi:hypothetical protein